MLKKCWDGKITPVPFGQWLVKDLLSSREVENIFENSDFVYMLNQAGGDRQILAKQLGISTHQLSYVTHSGAVSYTHLDVYKRQISNRWRLPATFSWRTDCLTLTSWTQPWRAAGKMCIRDSPEVAEVHILENESASRAYLLQVWAEAMSIYKRGRYSMKFTKGHPSPARPV